MDHKVAVCLLIAATAVRVFVFLSRRRVIRAVDETSRSIVDQ
jgi:hypothetical protein